MNTLSSGSLSSAQHHLQTAEVYTDINSLHNIKMGDDKDEAMRQVAQQFESMFISMMLKSMRDANAVFEKDSLFNSNETKFYRDMYDQQLSLSMAHTRQGGIGIAEAMYRQMSSAYGVKSDGVKNEGEGINALSGRVTGNLNQSAETSVKPLLSNEAKNTDVEKSSYVAIANSPEEFIRLVSPAIKTAADKLGVDEKLLTAQAALETGWGKSVLATDTGKSSFNLFNIKAGEHWQGNSTEVSTLEYTNETFKPEIAHFRTYDSIEDSVADYIQFVSDNPRYQKAINAAENAEHYIRELHSAGYATDPHYAEKILSIRERIANNYLTVSRLEL